MWRSAEHFGSMGARLGPRTGQLLLLDLVCAVPPSQPSSWDLKKKCHATSPFSPNCTSQHRTTRRLQVRVLLAAKAVLLPSGGAPSLPVRLPITQPEGFQDSLAGLELLLLHPPATAGEVGGGGQPGLWAEQSLLSLLGRSADLVERGGKAISCGAYPLSWQQAVWSKGLRARGPESQWGTLQ